jgi:phosphoribosyl 1,2-cyclic phosphodiesterase
MEITFWGTRGSIAAPGPDTLMYGGNTTCVEVTLSSGRTVILDAGTGIRKLGDALIKRKPDLHFHLLMTHIHWDHLMGFPFFGPVFRENSHLVIDGYPRGIEGLKRIFSSNFIDGTWPIRFEDLKARIEATHELRKGRMHLDNTIIESHKLQHPQGGMGFKFSEGAGTFVFLTDNELTDRPWQGTSPQDFVNFCRGADLLVHDCQYRTEEAEMRRGWGHSDVASVAHLAMKAEVGRLVLFHHDPWRTDTEVSAMVESCRKILAEAGSACQVDGAREGITLHVPG